MSKMQYSPNGHKIDHEKFSVEELPEPPTPVRTAEVKERLKLTPNMLIKPKGTGWHDMEFLVRSNGKVEVKLPADKWMLGRVQVFTANEVFDMIAALYQAERLFIHTPRSYYQERQGETETPPQEVTVQPESFDEDEEVRT